MQKATKTPKAAAKSSKASASSESIDVRNRIGSGGELHQLVAGPKSTATSAGCPFMTTNHGAPISDNQNSLRAGTRGPTLLQDFILTEKIAHFDRERIPERVVHARGAAAHGYFELTKSLKKYTTAKVLTEVGTRVPVFARLSTVAGSAGSMDTVRDVRGFAVKFYTDEGNWDLVGNNIPVFFIQDAMKFPDLVHSVKKEQDRGFPSAASAHDTFWDFISLMPESMHMVMWIMSDRTIPRSLRMIEGFGVHTFRLLNAKGESTFVKYHWRPVLGLQSLVWDEAVKIAGADQDYHRRDLWDAIESGDYPEWELAVQLFTEKQASEFAFDHLDATKLIPEELIPLTVIGRMTLNRNPTNFFAENEQSAFCPSRIVPGMDFSDDPLLLGRIFSYGDTQRHRLGGPNFHQLPINAAKCPVGNFQRDGFHQSNLYPGQSANEPRTMLPFGPRPSATGFTAHASRIDNVVVARARAESFADHYSQARMFFRSQTAVDQAHLASALVFELSKVQAMSIREAVLRQLRCVDEELATRVAKGLNIASLPKAAEFRAPLLDMPQSPAVQTVGKRPSTLKGRCVGILIDDGTDASLLKRMKTAVTGAGAKFKLIAPKIGGVKLSDGVLQPIDGQLAGTPSVLFDAVVVLLNAQAGERLASESAAIDFVRDAFGHLKAVAHSDGAKALIDAAGIDIDAFVNSANEIKSFIANAGNRCWAREPKLRTLA